MCHFNSGIVLLERQIYAARLVGNRDSYRQALYQWFLDKRANKWHQIFKPEMRKLRRNSKGNKCFFVTVQYWQLSNFFLFLLKVTNSSTLFSTWVFTFYLWFYIYCIYQSELLPWIVAKCLMSLNKSKSQWIMTRCKFNGGSRNEKNNIRIA